METPLLGHSRFHNEFTLDDGFGMIEVVISLFLLSILSFSFIPLLVNSIKSTGTNTTIATATQIVNQQIERCALSHIDNSKLFGRNKLP
jgi:prepilin-type N-terminal cleavage/methylation domain-containing protein